MIGARLNAGVVDGDWLTNADAGCGLTAIPRWLIDDVVCSPFGATLDVCGTAATA
jgi:hypothetical protein